MELDLGVHVGADITSVDVVRDLGVLLDSKLTTKEHQQDYEQLFLTMITKLDSGKHTWKGLIEADSLEV